MDTTPPSKTFHTLGILGMVCGIIIAVLGGLIFFSYLNEPTSSESMAGMVSNGIMAVNGALLIPLGYLAFRDSPETCKTLSFVCLGVAGVSVVIAIVSTFQGTGGISTVCTAAVQLIIPYLFLDTAKKVLAEKDA